MQYPISQLPGRQTNADIVKARATAMGKSRAAFVSGILTGILKRTSLPSTHRQNSRLEKIAFKLNRGHREHFIYLLFVNFSVQTFVIF